MLKGFSSRPGSQSMANWPGWQSRDASRRSVIGLRVLGRAFDDARRSMQAAQPWPSPDPRRESAAGWWEPRVRVAVRRAAPRTASRLDSAVRFQPLPQLLEDEREGLLSPRDDRRADADARGPCHQHLHAVDARADPARADDGTATAAHTSYTQRSAMGFSAAPEIPPVRLASTGAPASASMSMPGMVFTAQMASAPAATTARAIDRDAGTLGASFTTQGIGRGCLDPARDLRGGLRRGGERSRRARMPRSGRRCSPR